ncbi:hypothetical protein C5B42_00950 [Candidatus Cerribacteria bacterium 'Amazon FNV 2010 28 9']|uniref:Uncharacterized protein n=1 Tax=Candidatus Cerribacteria bacterium 'Amazon FNV 2010 28 9' TaxID=2081795 RepID=A0A317JQ56_9BACT|nr:MAG: hypothetical protein C5B42_00950 [Candidatus Cerribacteria bacterium 'Amazon FNV 2010 28 9']
MRHELPGSAMFELVDVQFLLDALSVAIREGEAQAIEEIQLELLSTYGVETEIGDKEIDLFFDEKQREYLQ